MQLHPYLQQRKTHLAVLLMLTSFLGVALYFIFRGFSRVDQQHWGDFRHFYWAAEAMRLGNNVYTSGEPPRCGYIYPPLIAYLYVPLSKLSMPDAAKFATVLNLAALMTALFLLAASVLNALKTKITLFSICLLVALTALISFDKIKGELQMFQTNGYILLMFALALYYLPKIPLIAGLALGLAFNIKYLVAALLPYLALRGYFRAALYTALAILFFAYLPAQLVGFQTETSYLAVAYSGMLKLFGIHMQTTGADIVPITSGMSISITSAVARIQRDTNLTFNPMYISAALFAGWTALILYLYHREKISIFKPRPSYLMTVTELIALLAATLVFSPQTNTRHTVLTAAVACLAVGLFIYGKLGNFKWLLAAAILTMLLGLDLPFTSQPDSPGPELHWHYYGGPMWCTLVAATFLLWAALKQENATRLNIIPTPAAEPAGTPPGMVRAPVLDKQGVSS